DYGRLAAGRYGNVILADKDLNLKAVIQKGVRIVGALYKSDAGQPQTARHHAVKRCFLQKEAAAQLQRPLL
ncbi:MAG: hypothetical protein UDI22_08105, partial [Faecalibacterium prausnitzii]|nr:hypothetical protein [Faecalibacterium prausnitzii]